MAQQKHFTKYSEHFTTPALRAFFPHQYFEDILQLCSQAEIISGCDMTPVLLSLSAFLTSYWLPAPVLFRILSVNWLGIIFVGHPQPGLAWPHHPHPALWWTDLISEYQNVINFNMHTPIRHAPQSSIMLHQLLENQKRSELALRCK